MENQVMCSIGTNVKGPNCNLTSVQDISEFSAVHRELIELRCNLQADKISSVCSIHKEYFLNKYQIHQKKCCNLFDLHPNQTKKASMRVISLSHAKLIRSRLHIDAIPGKKLCSTCRKQTTKLLESYEHNGSSEASDSSVEDDFQKDIVPEVVEREKDRDKLNESLTSAGVSPLKLHAVAKHSKVSVGKRKLRQAKTALRKKVASTLDLEDENVLTSESFDDEDDQTKRKASEFDKLTQMVKDKLQQVSHREKIQMLTLVPESWSRKNVVDFFKVTDYQVRQSRKLLQENGLLSLPEIRFGKRLSQETVQAVHKFYEDDEFSRLMPGKKDKVSIKKNVHVQKRLLLCNLHELYVQFQLNCTSSIKIGFSKFADLRPKHCVLAGSSGTHSVCVCTIHQNVQLLIAAAGFEESYHDFMQKLVCSQDSRDCMLRVCNKCPNENILESFLKSKFPEYDHNDTIAYKQWISTDRVDLTSHTSSLEDFINLFVKKIEKLIPHSYISKSQSRYLKKRKEELSNHEALILMDFSENFSFVLQDEVQGYHWTHGCCTLHTIVLYVNDKNSVKSESFCLLSDDMEHDLPMVYHSQKLIIQYLKVNYPQVIDVEYFTDGCAAQYKNCKIFLNLCHHKRDFGGIKAKWSFFATSHGKSACDGVGGTIKRIVSKASLQRPLHNQITSVIMMYDYCQENIKGITFFMVSKIDMIKIRSEIYQRLQQATTIPGTRSMHYFEPTSSLSIRGKRISADENFSVCASFDKNITDTVDTPSVNSYVVCIYDSNWYVGLILEVHTDEGDATIKFMHPHGPSPSFYWPEKDNCIVPFTHILCAVDITTITGRTYKLSDESTDLVNSKWTKYTSK